MKINLIDIIKNRKSGNYIIKIKDKKILQKQLKQIQCENLLKKYNMTYVINYTENYVEIGITEDYEEFI